jgi:hypothetical protein
MPLIVLNMGGEMTYILNQRLKAQSVQDEKSQKVLQDVVRAMYSPLFIEELFKPQDTYSTNSTKQIFEKLAHSSIMRLNRSSMDKLYDLMCMGFKYQIISCSCPQQYLQVTLNHLETLKGLVQNQEVYDLIQLTIEKCIGLYSGLSNGQWGLVKQSIFRFFQGKRIKVSLFLQQSLQSIDGALILNHQGELPFGTELPGTIRFFEGDNVARVSKFETVLKTGCTESTAVIDPLFRLGMNMYSKDIAADSAVAQAKSSGLNQAAALKNLTGNCKDDAPRSNFSSPPPKDPNVRKITASSAKAELTMLADLLGIPSALSSPSTKGEQAESKHFKINLFPDPSGFMKNDGSKEDSNEESSNFIMIDIDGTADTKTFESYMNDLDLKDSDSGDSKAGSKQVDDDDDDLLALMDSCK